ncbi:MAG TPA: sulfotransferase family 2 domain-containing protein [Anaerolineales bacterium]|nr:sulfotransferase family 2 domain-containing protein [Anaerolineales bacterium]
MLVFIHINKTAGSTLRYILRSSYGLRHCEVEPWQARWNGSPFSSQDLQRLRKIYPHLESIAGHRVTGYIDLKENGTEFKYFTFLRDPVKTCASRFQYNIQYRGKKDLVFEEWIQKDWTRNAQTKLIAGVPDINEVIRIIQKKNIFVGLTERFDESLLMLKALVVTDLNIAYKRVNVANNNSIAKNLQANSKTREMLVEANQVDLELYEYVRKELFPAQQKEYGPSLEADALKYQQNRENNFNNLNLTLSRLKQYLLYKPLIYLYQRDLKVV